MKGGKRNVRQAPCLSKAYQKTVNNITNEAFNSNPCIPVRDGYPLEYSCLGDIGNGTIVEPLTVSFNYEVWINQGGATLGILQNIRALEWSILYNVAAAISLDKCKLSNQRIPRRLTGRDDDIPRWRELQDNNATRVVFLSSPEPGVINLHSGSCGSQPSSADTICVPVKGTMLAEHTGNNPFVVEAYLKDTIAKEMSRKTILISDVTSVHYVGGGSTPSQAFTPQASQTNLSGVAIGGTTVAVTILLLGLFVFLRKRSGPKREAYEVGNQRLEDVDKDEEEEEEDDDDDETQDISTQTDEAIIDVQVTELTDMTEESIDEPSVDEKSRALPSRQKRKRKKKKMKKQKIVRVSSRTSVDEMETITEEFEETGESSTQCITDDGSTEFQPHDPWISGPFGPTRVPPLSLSDLTAANEPARLPPSPIIEERKIRRLPPPWV